MLDRNTRNHSTVSRSSWIRRLHLCKWVTPINECPDMTLNFNWRRGSSPGTLWNAEYFVAIASKSILTRSGITWSIKWNCFDHFKRCVNKWLMFSSICSDKYQYLEAFNCMQTNKQCWIELLVFNRNIRNHFTVCCK